MVPNGLNEILEAYGKPWNADGTLNETWEANNIVRAVLPFPMYYEGKKKTTVQIHRKCADELAVILQEIWNAARLKVKQEVGFDKTTAQYDWLTRAFLEKRGLDQFGGSFAFRSVRGRKKYSMHAWGAAIDIDPWGNPLGATTGRMPLWVVEIFEKRGWLWGGHFKGRKDPMHFQRATGY